MPTWRTNSSEARISSVSEVELPAADAGQPLRLVEQRAARLQLVARAPDALELQVRAHPREQLARGERLDEVVVGARLQALDRALLARARGEHDHRHVAQQRVLVQRRAAARSRRGWASSRRSARGRAGGRGRARARPRRPRRSRRGTPPPAATRRTSRMSALSSTTSTSGRSSAGRAVQLAARAPASAAPRRRSSPRSARRASPPSSWSAAVASAASGTRTVKRLPRARLALDVDRAAVQRGELGDEREPDARALVGARARVDDAVEALEQPLLVGGARCRCPCRRRRARATSPSRVDATR